MQIVCFCNNRLGWQLLDWLAQRGDEIKAVVVHPPKSGKYVNEIRSCAAQTGAAVFEGDELADPQVLGAIRQMKPEIGVSVMFGYILRKPLLDVFPKGCINLHPALLPYNRGAYPNVWSIVEKTPAGATLHYIDEGIDTGDIVAQQEVPVSFTDTGATLYSKLMEASLELFQKTWPEICAGTAQRWPQKPGGSFHKMRDVESIDEIFLDRSYRAEDLINLIRARTFPPHRGAYVNYEGRKVYLRLELFEEVEGESELR